MSEIKLNAVPGSSVKISAEKVSMKNVDVQTSGGIFHAKATSDLIQEENVMEASSGGEIINESARSLQQFRNIMKAPGGTIKNRTTGFSVVVLILLSAIVGIIRYIR